MGGFLVLLAFDNFKKKGGGIMRVGVKVGSIVVTKKDGSINQEFISEVCRQAGLAQKEHEFFIVSSGAVASDPNIHRSKNLRAMVGQPNVANAYKKEFRKQGIDSGELLVVDADLLTGQSRLLGIFKKIFPFVKKSITRVDIFKRNMEEAFKEKVIIVLNGNDGIDDEAIKALEKCADNDVLFKLACLLLNVDLAIIVTDKDGLLDNESQVVPRIWVSTRREDIIKFYLAVSYAKKGNAIGHSPNGMRTKVLVAGELAINGIRTILVPAKKDSFILKAIAGEKNFGTTFLPNQ